MKHALHIRKPQYSSSRRGAVAVFAALMLVVALGFAAFTVDFGMIALTKSQVQNAADSASHAATMELSRGFGPGAVVSMQTAESNARAEAVSMVNRFRSGEMASTPADPVRDIRFGRRHWDSVNGVWQESWGTQPYNMAEVTVRRTEAVNAEVPAVFGAVLGRDHFDVTASGVSAMYPGIGFGAEGDADHDEHDHDHHCKIDILPITLDLGSWNRLLNQIHNGHSNGYNDNLRYREADGSVSWGEDGIPEINIYPDLNSNEAPGNRGTVDLGAPSNKTADLVRQIVDGLNEYDLSFFPNNQIIIQPGSSIQLNGDTGISAGIEDALRSIVGQIRAIPIFISVTGNGNNANYTIVKFVGVRIMGVRLNGGPRRRHLSVQPAPFSSCHVIRGNVPFNVDSIMTPPVTIR